MMDCLLITSDMIAVAHLSLLFVAFVLTEPLLMDTRLNSAANPSPGLSGSLMIFGGRKEDRSIPALVSA